MATGCSASSESLIAAGVTICDVVHKKFEPQGVTVLALLSESHASIHTYPESGDIFVDVFTCGTCEPHKAVAVLKRAFEPSAVQLNELKRGVTL